MRLAFPLGRERTEFLTFLFVSQEAGWLWWLHRVLEAGGAGAPTSLLTGPLCISALKVEAEDALLRGPELIVLVLSGPSKELCPVFGSGEEEEVVSESRS